MALFNRRSVYMSRILCSTAQPAKLVPGIFKNTIHTYNLKLVPSTNFVKLYSRHLFFNSNSQMQITASRYYSSEKSTTEDNASDTEEHKRAKAWKKMKLSLIFMGTSLGLMFCSSFYIFGSPDRDENNEDIEDEFTGLPILQQWWSRFYHKIWYYTKVIQEPSHEKLLPDPLTHPYIQPPYTLVIELTDVLVHPDWTYETGWRFKKRPHVDAFLQQLCAPLYEIVVFTAEQAYAMVPIVNQLNKNGLITYSLFRDSTEFRENHHVKNLDWLNRDLSKVIVVDWNSKSVKLHPDNAFIIPRWRGNDEDEGLLELASFLKMIAFNQVDDVREVLSYYRDFEDPLAKYRENQQVLLEQMAEQERIEQAKKERPPLTQRFSKSYAQR